MTKLNRLFAVFFLLTNTLWAAGYAFAVRRAEELATLRPAYRLPFPMLQPAMAQPELFLFVGGEETEAGGRFLRCDCWAPYTTVHSVVCPANSRCYSERVR